MFVVTAFSMPARRPRVARATPPPVCATACRRPHRAPTRAAAARSRSTCPARSARLPASGPARRTAARASVRRRRYRMRSALSSAHEICRRPGIAHHGGGAVDLALQVLGFVSARIPVVGNLPALGVERHRRVVAARRRHHPPAPVFGHDRHPRAGQVDRPRRRASVRGNLRRRTESERRAVPAPTRPRTAQVRAAGASTRRRDDAQSCVFIGCPLQSNSPPHRQPSAGPEDRAHAQAEVARRPRRVAGDDEVVADLQRVSRDALLAELAAASPFGRPALRLPLGVLRRRAARTSADCATGTAPGRLRR